MWMIWTFFGLAVGGCLLLTAGLNYLAEKFWREIEGRDYEDKNY